MIFIRNVDHVFRFIPRYLIFYVIIHGTLKKAFEIVIAYIEKYT